MYSLITLTNIQANAAYANNENDTSPITGFFFGFKLPYMSFEEMNKYWKIKLSIVETGKADVPLNLIQCTKQMWNSRGIYN